MHALPSVTQCATPRRFSAVAQLAPTVAPASQIARMAVSSLHDELTLHPKPGLVTPFCNGSHRDMTAHTLLRSLFALRHYFKQISQAGIDRNGFAVLRQLGIDAEQQMLRATAGINTHRGAIFVLGLLCAAIGAARAQHTVTAILDAELIRQTLLQRWAANLLEHAVENTSSSHGTQVRVRYGIDGAREQAAAGFPAVFEIGLPQLRATLSTGRGWSCACIDTLFALMSTLNDTNVVHRGGIAGGAAVRELAQDFLAAGGTGDIDWRNRAARIGEYFVGHNLSPGGAADLLAATCLVYRASAPNRLRG